MASLPSKFCVLTASLGVAWLATGVPAHAAGEKSEAKEACADLLQDKGYNNVDIDQTKKKGDDKVVVQGDATRQGDRGDVGCVYNSETDKARLKK